MNSFCFSLVIWDEHAYSCSMKYLYSRKFYIRRNNNKVNSIETGRIVIADLLPLSDLGKCMYTTLFQLMMIKFYRHYLIYEYNFTFLPFYMTHTLCKMCPNTEIFLICIFPHLDWIRRYSVRMRENTDQKKLRIWTLFTQW